MSSPYRYESLFEFAERIKNRQIPVTVEEGLEEGDNESNVEPQEEEEELEEESE